MQSKSIGFNSVNTDAICTNSNSFHFKSTCIELIPKSADWSADDSNSMISWSLIANNKTGKWA